MRKMIAETPGSTSTTSWSSIRETFLPPEDFEREVLLAGAVKVGTTRLIDNLRIA